MSKSNENNAGDPLFTVSIHVPSYILTEGQITRLAEEFYGRQVDTTGIEGHESGTVEYGFEGPQAAKNGEFFRSTLDNGFMKR